ncbi:tRNA lysidine(34) synthetase TilS [Brevundimonas naejangsanensis]|uniref:tRNA(Ile)-lysidine synthetase n=1 Tax=Brevundimonas naejangsanensis TaxID=588932 RepID=A0A494RCZ7_9CAUL|nr:tRNA lysidine(34) synthetase TilS [Brevundimonas naejangsanensis]
MSGGGDSLALLDLAAAWARARGRRLLALTVDHALHSDSAAWTRFAGAAARAAGADWRGLSWEGARGGSGVPARARAARHALLAETAREAGAGVILTGHTADDVAEGEWMRAHGANLGRLRDWSPSPAWPEGRGLMLLRPLLDERRETLREHLRARGLDWLEDPANADLRFGRGRARAALSSEALPLDAGRWGGGVAAAAADQARQAPTVPSREAHSQLSRARPRSFPHRGGRETVFSPDLAWAGVLTISRDLSASALAATLLCAGGGATPPRGDRLAALQARLASGEDFVAVLCGARVEAAGARVLAMREPGEMRRRPPAPVALAPGRPAAWDGRFEITTDETDLRVEAAAGRLARLSDAERALLARLPAAARAAAPVLIGADGDRPVLAWGAAAVTALAPRRLALAVGETTQEEQLFHALDGETPPTDLFSAKDC